LGRKEQSGPRAGRSEADAPADGGKGSVEVVAIDAIPLRRGAAAARTRVLELRARVQEENARRRAERDARAAHAPEHIGERSVRPRGREERCGLGLRLRLECYCARIGIEDQLERSFLTLAEGDRFLAGEIARRGRLNGALAG